MPRITRIGFDQVRSIVRLSSIKGLNIFRKVNELVAIKPNSRLQTGYVPELDGLRAIAVFAVIFWHAGALFSKDRLLVPGGFFGVDVFFVLSGFLITRLLFGTTDITLTDFLFRRIRRLYPALVLVITATVVASVFMLTPRIQTQTAEDGIFALLSISNLLFSGEDSYWTGPSQLRPLLHTWTLGLEIQFYLVFAVLAIALRSRVNAFAAVIASLALPSFVLAVIAAPNNQQAAFYLLPYRFWEFAIGGFLALHASKCRPPPILGDALGLLGLAALFFAFLFLDESNPHPSVITLIPVLGTAAILLTAPHAQPASPLKVLRHTSLVVPGILSYGAYLVHQPLIALFRLHSGVMELSWMSIVFLISLTFFIAYFLFILVETPIRRHDVLSAKSAGSVIAVSVVAALVVGGSVQHWSSNARYQDPYLATDRWVKERANGVRCGNESANLACTIGATSVSPSLALIGDSHAQALSGALDAYLTERGESAMMYIMAGCPFISGVRRFNYPRDCNTHLPNVLEDLDRRNINKIIILDRINAYLLGTGGVAADGTKEPVDTRLYDVALGEDAPRDLTSRRIADRYFETIDSLSQKYRILVFLPLPEMGVHVPETLAAMAEDHPMPTVVLPRRLHDGRLSVIEPIRRMARDRSSLSLIETADAFCDQQLCRANRGTDVYYSDRDHPSRKGAETIIETFEPELSEFLANEPAP